MRASRLVPAFVLAVVLASAASAAQPPLRVQGFTKIGAFVVRGGTPAKAKRAFGKPTRTRELRDSCELIWPGLTISFYTLVHDRQCRDDTPFGEARITRPWVTERGLRQGDPVAKAKQLYPAARKAGHPFGASGVWLVVRFSQAIGDYGLGAEVRSGRMTALVISDPQGGE